MAIQLNEIQSSEWSFDINNLGKVVQGLDDIKQCIKIIIETEPGSDPLRPDFGCGIYTQLDLPITSVSTGLKKAIIEALTKYELRIEKIKVDVKIDTENVTFSLTYQIKNTVKIDQLELIYGLTNS